MRETEGCDYRRSDRALTRRVAQDGHTAEPERSPTGTYLLVVDAGRAVVTGLGAPGFADAGGFCALAASNSAAADAARC